MKQTKNILYFIITVLIFSFLFSCQKEDNTPPEITIEGKDTVYLPLNTPFDDPGALAFDIEEGDLSNSVLVTTELDINQTGIYKVYYTVTDESGNKAETVRYVIVFNEAEKYAATYQAELTAQGGGNNLLYTDGLKISETKNHVVITNNFLDDSLNIEIYARPGDVEIQTQSIIFHQDTLMAKTDGAGSIDSLSMNLNILLLKQDSTVEESYHAIYNRINPL
ncbi:MAG: DUF5011 domain-containing protein [Bacteroidales bacterium]